MKKVLPDTPLMFALDLCRRVTDRRSHIPILSHVIVSANKGSWELTASDLDVELTIDLPMSADAAFAAAAPAEALHRICAVHGVLGFEPGRHGVLHVLGASGCAYQLATLAAADFPRFDKWKPEYSFTLDGAELLADLKAVRDGISTEETRYYLNGVFWHQVASEPNLMRFAATDGHRLYLVRRPLPEGARNLPGLIIPRKVVAILIAALERSSDAVEVEMIQSGLGGRVRFIFGDIVLTAKCIEGTYPAYDRVIPIDPPGALACSASALSACAEAVGAIMEERTRALALHFVNGGGTISAKSANGSVSMALPGLATALPEAIGLNAAYLVDALKPFGNRQVALRMTGPADPILIEAVGQAPGSPIVVQMPMRLT